MLQFLTMDINPVPMSEKIAKWYVKKRWLPELGFGPLQLEELVLGNEGDQKIHTLKAKGRVYCRI